MGKQIKITTLKRKADDIWSIFVRIDEADRAGNCHCCSCGATYPWQDMDCGHFVSRNHNAARYRRDNCHAQCRKCNRFREGNKAGYAVYLQNKYGGTILDDLNQLQYTIKRFTVEELQEIILTAREGIKRAKEPK